MISTDTKAPRTSENSERKNVSEKLFKKVLIEHFHSNGQHLCKFIGTKEIKAFAKEKSSTPRGLVWDTNMVAISLFWHTNMVAVTSRENT